MKKVLVLGTGGTIACSVKQTEGKRPMYSTEQILEFVPGLNRVAEIVSDAPIRERGRQMYIDSSNMQPEYMAQVAERIFRGYQEGIDGVVVLGGTDTMEESGADLTFMLLYKKIPVVLTGSMRPPDHKKSDVPKNVMDAVRFAAYEMPGTYIVFNGRVISAAKAKKINPDYVDAFRSVNLTQVGRFIDGRFHSQGGYEPLKNALQRYEGREMDLRNTVSLRTHLLSLYRGLRPSILDTFFNDEYYGIIIEAFGTGGIPNTPHYRSLIKPIKRWSEKRLIGITARTFTGQTTAEYEVSIDAFDAGALSLGDMLSPTALSKANWLFGQVGARDIERVKKLMLFPFEAEIKEEVAPKDRRLNVEEMLELLYANDG